jgi:Cof subfamily protein (haloacid dehalogenase superfamily)
MNYPMSYLIVCDIDHTLLNDAGQLVIKNVKALKKARVMGATVVLATARGFAGAKLIHEALGLDTPMIVSNGTLVCTPQGVVMKAQTIESTRARQIIELFVNTQHHWSFHNLEAAFIHPQFDTRRPPFDNPQHYRPTRLEHLETVLDPKALVTATLFGWGLKDFIHQHPWQHWQLTLDFYEPNAFTPLEAMSVMSNQANKGQAVSWLRTHLRLEQAPTLCIGDSAADATMFPLGIGVAPANASESVRSQARWVAPHCDEGAVASALEKFVLGVSAI